VRPYLEKTLHKKGLVEWLKVKALSSNPSTTKPNQNKKTQTNQILYFETCHLKDT
jgi:hypothetical protein